MSFVPNAWPAAREFLALSLVLSLTVGCTPEPATERLPGMHLRLGSVLGDTELTGFARAEHPRAFTFPEDHGPHPTFRSEWWYLTLVLEDGSGSELGVQFTLFRQALRPEAGAPEAAGPEAVGQNNRWQTPQIYLAHLAVTDVASEQHLAFERFARGHPALAGARSVPFAVWLEDWRLEADASTGAWRLRAGTPGLEVDVSLASGVKPVLQGEGGLSRKGREQASYYYSMPRMPASGRIVLGDKEHAVQGLGWLDREWSTSVLSEAQIGWDWFALQLDDGRSIMVFQLRREDGRRDEHDHGILVAADGFAQTLTAADFELEPLRVWKDDEGIGWPVEWTVSVAGERWRVAAVLDDQKMSTSVRYWEGMVRVTDEAGEAVGRGYLELTGYEGRDDEQQGYDQERLSDG